MTPQEIVAALEDSNRALLESRKLPVSPAMLDLMNHAAINGFKLGSSVATSMVEGAITVKLASWGKGLFIKGE